MLLPKDKQLNFYSQFFDRIPETHILKKTNNVLDFGFINKLLEDIYCKYFGRPAREPEMMLRILMIQHLYYLSNELIMEEIQVNLAYMWFVGINPDEKLPHSSLISKLKTLRLKDISLDEIIINIVKQCIDKGIIKAENGISIDSTHVLANTTKKVPERLMKHLAKKYSRLWVKKTL